jgi:argininosuccinate lyase
MPQKRNPDVAELVRGKAGRLVGNLVSLMTVLKGLPTGYNRDLQEDKETLFDSVDTLKVVLPAVAGAVGSAEFQSERIEAALDTQLLATDLADYLVRTGVPFRKAHEAVATVVRIAEERGAAVDDLGIDDFQAAHPSFGPDVLDVFSWERSVEARSAPGGTARAPVLAQIEAAAGKLEDS